MAINALTWESDFFSQRIGKVDLTALEQLSFAEYSQWDVVQAKISSADYWSMDKLSRQGFVLAEGEVELAIAIKETTRQVGIRIARPSHIDSLRYLASTLFTATRFRAPWFEPPLIEQFYAQWIDNAVQGCFDDQCLIKLDSQGDIAGFISLRETDGVARIGLLGVSPEHRGQGAGSELLLAALDWARAKGCSQLLITTQLSNLAAMRLYLRHDARVLSTHYWLYRKRDDSV